MAEKIVEEQSAKRIENDTDQQCWGVARNQTEYVTKRKRDTCQKARNVKKQIGDDFCNGQNDS